MALLTDLICTDFDLVIGQEGQNYYKAYISYKGVKRDISRETAEIIKNIIYTRPVKVINNNDVHQITHDEIKHYYLNELPIVEVTAKAPTNNNKKLMIMILLSVFIILSLFAPKKNKK